MCKLKLPVLRNALRLVLDLPWGRGQGMGATIRILQGRGGGIDRQYHTNSHIVQSINIY